MAGRTRDGPNFDSSNTNLHTIRYQIYTLLEDIGCLTLFFVIILTSTLSSCWNFASGRWGHIKSTGREWVTIIPTYVHMHGGGCGAGNQEPTNLFSLSPTTTTATACNLQKEASIKRPCRLPSLLPSATLVKETRSALSVFLFLSRRE